jgi:hypothetical protein
MSACIGVFAEHFFGVLFRECYAHLRIGLHFRQPLPDFTLLRANENRRSLDFIPMLVKPTREGASLR